MLRLSYLRLAAQVARILKTEPLFLSKGLLFFLHKYIIHLQEMLIALLVCLGQAVP